VSVPNFFTSVAMAFSQAGLGPYFPSVAHWPGTPVFDDGGSISEPGLPIELDCMAQVDAATQAMRAEVGYVGTDISLLVLCSTLDGQLDTDATIEVTAGPNAGSYSVQSVSKDPMGSHFICRGRRD